jgi:hypothetical protein
MSNITAGAGRLTEAGYHVWKSWKPMLEDAKYGPTVNDFQTQQWSSIVLENTMSGGPAKDSENYEHKSKINRLMMKNYYNINESSGQVESQKVENIRESLMEDAIHFASDSEDMVLVEAESYGNSHSTAAGQAYQGTDTIGGIAKRLPLLFRRGITDLIAPAFMGVQPLTSNHGYVYTIKGRYRGNGDQKIALGQGYVFVLASSVDALANWAPDKSTAIGSFSATSIGHVTQLNSGATGIVRFREGTKVLVEKTVDANNFTSTAVDTLSVGNGSSAGQNATAPSALFDNEAGYKRFFENYTFGDFLPNYTDFATRGGNTAAFSEASTEVQEMGLTITQNRVLAQTRKLKASWPKEVQEDLDRNAQLNFMAEIMRELYREINLNMNREVVRLINNNARQIPSFDIGTGTDGRWFVEKIMGFVSQIDAQAEASLIDTRRGRGNRLLVSPLVRVALAQLPIWSQNKIQGTMLNDVQSYAGNLGGKYEVHTDIFAETDYVNVAYKGPMATDAGYFWCPYIGLQFADATHPENLWDTIAGLRTRYGILRNPFGTNLYYRYMPVTGISDLGFSFA